MDTTDPQRTSHEDHPEPPIDAGPAVDIDERAYSVLAELAHEGEAEVAFQGLRRRLGIHQQSLTRVLEDLQAQGLVDDARRGYRLTEAGYDALHADPPPPYEGDTSALAQALLPPFLEEGAVVHRLEQRWFQGLRWYGIVEAPDETVLVWLTDPGQRFVRLRLHGGAFTLEAQADGDPDGALFRAIHPLLGTIGELYGLDPGSTSVQALAVDERPFAA